jgi:hypothetical protein
MNRLAFMDRPTGRPIRRYEHDQPGDLVHLDVKKLGRIPAEGGHRIHGRATGTVNRRADRSAGGYDYLHARSTITRGWPMSRSWVTSGPRVALGSGAAPTAGCLAWRHRPARAHR